MNTCRVGVCSAPAHCREIGRCGHSRSSDLSASQLTELCAVFGWQGGTYHQVLAEIKRAVSIADDCMTDQLASYGVPIDAATMLYGMADDSGHEVRTLAEAGACMREASQWLIDRGLAVLETEGDGNQVVRVKT